MNLTIAITTAPRKTQTLADSIRTLREAGYTLPIYIFAEPSLRDYYHILDRNVKFFQHRRKKGCFKNFDYVLQYMINYCRTKYFAIFQDDFIYKKTFLQTLETFDYNNNSFGYLCTFTPNGMKHNLDGQQGWCRNKIGWHSWGANYIMNKDTATKLIKSPFYQQHKKYYVINQQIDACCSEAFHRLNIPCYYHIPSISRHIGHHSTLKHNHDDPKFHAVEIDSSITDEIQQSIKQELPLEKVVNTFKK